MDRMRKVLSRRETRQQSKDLVFIFLGILLYAVGYTAFILPEQIVMGGVSGISALLFYAFQIPPALSLWGINILLMVIAFRGLTRQFTIRTIIGVTMMSVLVGTLQPLFAAYPIITAGRDTFMHVMIGGMMGGAGLGIVFAHNGSTGGTDIIVALMTKYFRMSFGRAMQLVDICIICSSYLLFGSMEKIVYGVAFTLVASYMCDYVINGTRQTVQFLIISKRFDAIADAVNHQMHRGVTILDGQGWYSKQPVKVVMVLARKYEAQYVFNIIKNIDPNAMVSQNFCHGVFGEGFDKIK